MNIGIIGGTGYVGGELLRLLINHPKVEVKIVTSRKHIGKYVYRIHPNLRKHTKLKFTSLDSKHIVQKCELVFLATPHGAAMELVPKLLELGIKTIDMSADYRLKTSSDYEKWYGWKHQYPKTLKKAVYGLPELYRDKIRNAQLVACPGCMPTASILGLAPLIKQNLIEEKRIVIDVKIGSSGAGAQPTPASHHPERFGGVRVYNVQGHRHIAEIEQELNLLSDNPVVVSFTPHAVNMVRGILATIHVFPKKQLTIRQIWRIFRSFYNAEPFIRLFRDVKGLYRLPNPNITIGSNYCDIGFELDSHFNHLLVFSALDNMMKGASGQGVQCLNIILNIDEKTGLKVPGFHPM